MDSWLGVPIRRHPMSSLFRESIAKGIDEVQALSLVACRYHGRTPAVRRALDGAHNDARLHTVTATLRQRPAERAGLIRMGHCSRGTAALR